LKSPYRPRYKSKPRSEFIAATPEREVDGTRQKAR
jgi:hypothetical protein